MAGKWYHNREVQSKWEASRLGTDRKVYFYHDGLLPVVVKTTTAPLFNQIYRDKFILVLSHKYGWRLFPYLDKEGKQRRIKTDNIHENYKTKK